MASEQQTPPADFHEPADNTGDPHNEDGDDISVISSDLDELGPGDFSSYFREQDHRLFHSHGGLPYPLPVDGPEQQFLGVQRQDMLHRVLKQVFGENFIGPVPVVLAPAGDRVRRALDICNGTGIWLEEMSEQFPHVRFSGLDIVPISTRTPPNNVHFEMHNVAERFRWQEGTMDFVHARSVDMAVSNYPGLLAEVGRVLRPGGLFLSGEWSWGPTLQDAASSEGSQTPAIDRLINWVTHELHVRKGISPAAPHIRRWLQESGQFVAIESGRRFIPVRYLDTDPQRFNIGRDLRVAWARYADSLMPFMRDAQLAESDIREMVEGYMNELYSNRDPGLVGVFQYVHAKKRPVLVAGR